jgi:short-subunit dehydrogenase
LAAYSASKAALSAYLEAVRRERRRDLSLVLDVRPGHLETGFADHALAGEPPKLPPPGDTEDLVERILDAIETGARELSYDPRTRELSQA